MARTTIVRITPLPPTHLSCAGRIDVTARLGFCNRTHLLAACHSPLASCRSHLLSIRLSTTQSCRCCQFYKCLCVPVYVCTRVCVPVHWYYAFYVFTSPLLSAGMHFMCFIRFICASGYGFTLTAPPAGASSPSSASSSAAAIEATMRLANKPRKRIKLKCLLCELKATISRWLLPVANCCYCCYCHYRCYGLFCCC